MNPGNNIGSVLWLIMIVIVVWFVFTSNAPSL